MGISPAEVHCRLWVFRSRQLEMEQWRGRVLERELRFLESSRKYTAPTCKNLFVVPYLGGSR